uniref:COPII coat assembly protein SEC16 n=1 Tax=Lygus hesperus TaxID=30085 RepID=A0A0A9Z4B3_LYGHE
MYISQLDSLLAVANQSANNDSDTNTATYTMSKNNNNNNSSSSCSTVENTSTSVTDLANIVQGSTKPLSQTFIVSSNSPTPSYTYLPFVANVHDPALPKLSQNDHFMYSPIQTLPTVLNDNGINDNNYCTSFSVMANPNDIPT